MAQLPSENPVSSLELRFKRWTAVAVVCFLGLLAALPFRSTPHSPIAPSHRERSLRFRADSPIPSASEEIPTRRISEERVITRRVSEGGSATTLPNPTMSQAAPRPAVSTSPSSSLPTIPDPAPTPQPPAPNSPTSSPQPPVPASTAALEGENLMDIAQRTLGDRRRWRELVDLNPKHRSPFDVLKTGEEIALPAANDAKADAQP